MKIGYGRVSTDGQTLDAQQAQLKAAGCDKVYAEKISGAKADRPQLAKLLKAIDKGDTVIVSRLDRLARSTRDLLNILQAITEKGAGFKVLDQPALDTTSAYGQLLLNVLGAIGQFERDMIHARTSEGRARAKEAGVHLGRPQKLTPHQRSEALKRRDAGETLTAIGKSYNVSHATISRL